MIREKYKKIEKIYLRKVKNLNKKSNNKFRKKVRILRILQDQSVRYVFFSFFILFQILTAFKQSKVIF